MGSVIHAAATSESLEEFADYGEQALTNTVVGAATGAAVGFLNASFMCFAEGTLISAASGLVSIEEIQSGDYVWAHNEETGETSLKEVVQLFRNETNEWIHLTVNGEEIVCTPKHPFYSPVKGWTNACHLRAGDILVTLNGKYVVVEQIQHELLESPETTYNFEVADFHTYYVGDINVLVHNRGCGQDYFPDRGTPDSTQIRYDSNGKVYSAATYGSDEIKIARIDFQGAKHFVKSVGDKILPHVHLFANNNGFLREFDTISLEDFLRRFYQ